MLTVSSTKSSFVESTPGSSQPFVWKNDAGVTPTAALPSFHQPAPEVDPTLHRRAPRRFPWRWLVVGILVLVAGLGATMVFGVLPRPSWLGGLSLTTIVRAITDAPAVQSAESKVIIQMDVRDAAPGTVTFPTSADARTGVQPWLGALPAFAQTAFTIEPVGPLDQGSSLPFSDDSNLPSASILDGTLPASGPLLDGTALHLNATDAYQSVAGSSFPQFRSSVIGTATWANVTYAFDLEFRAVGETFYVRANGLPSLPFFDLQPFTNTWVSMTARALEQDSGILPNLEVPTPDTEKIRAFTDRVAQAAEETKAIFIEKDFGNETVGDAKVRHVRVNIDPDQFIAFERRVWDAWREIDPFEVGAGTIDSSPPLTADDLPMLTAYAKNAKHDLWIDLQTGQLHQVRYELAVRPEGDELIPAGKQLTAIVEYTQLSVNQPVTVEAPTESIPFGQFFAEALSDGEDFSALEPNASGTDPFADTDGDGLSDLEERSFGTDPAVADTDGDGYSDKTEIDNGFDPLAAPST